MIYGRIDRYVIGALLPYLALATLILTAVLLTQQAARLADVLGASGAPLQLVTAVVFNLLPNILVFSLPMSVLTGTATGLGRMGGDSELVAIRAAGVGTWRIMAPVLVLGLGLCLLTLYIGFVLAPGAAQNIRGLALRAALHKLESPVEPRSFYTGMPGKVVYVRDGDKEKGQWGRVFIHWLEADGGLRLVTAREGSLDASGEQTELVLADAVITTLPKEASDATSNRAAVTNERSTGLRIRDDRLNQSRSHLLKKMQERELELEEMNWGQLRERIRTGSDKESGDASLALHRRLSLCLAPLAFVLLGGGFGLKIGRRGRSSGVLASLAALILYYLVALGGEQLARAGLLPAALGAWLAFALSMVVGTFLIISYRRHSVIPSRLKGLRLGNPARNVAQGRGRRGYKLLGLLDRVILTSLLQNFCIVLVSLTLVFFIFTLFELLRFLAAGKPGAALVGKYLFYLIPFVGVSITPVSTLLAVLITFALLARRNEAVSWWASGQSVYRLLLPCFIFAACVGAALWAVQERVMPEANRTQNSLRAQIKGGGVQSEPQTGRFWVASGDGKRIYFYEPGAGGRLEWPTVFEFEEDGVHLRRVVSGRAAGIDANQQLSVEGATELDLTGGRVLRREAGSVSLAADDPELFKYELNKPAELDAKGLSAYIKSLKKSDRDVQPLFVALERKKAEPFAPFVMALLGAPLALAFGRRSAVTALCAAICIALTFLGLVSGLQQVGAGGLLPPSVAAWAPAFIFAVAGIYLLTRTKT